MIKVLVLGDKGVGKSTLIKRFVHHLFVTQYEPTTQYSLYPKELIIHDESYLLGIIDTNSNIDMHLKEIDSIILVYSITDLSSFLSIPAYLTRINKLRDNVTICLVGTKSDLFQQRKVSTQIAKQLANEYNIPFYEVSSFNRNNINFPFISMTQKLSP